MRWGKRLALEGKTTLSRILSPERHSRVTKIPSELQYIPKGPPRAATTNPQYLPFSSAVSYRRPCLERGRAFSHPWAVAILRVSLGPEICFPVFSQLLLGRWSGYSPGTPKTSPWWVLVQVAVRPFLMFSGHLHWVPSLHYLPTPRCTPEPAKANFILFYL